jgi:hypothetical protein
MRLRTLLVYRISVAGIIHACHGLSDYRVFFKWNTPALAACNLFIFCSYNGRST